jgi:hypothetical protein
MNETPQTNRQSDASQFISTPEVVRSRADSIAAQVPTTQPDDVEQPSPSKSERPEAEAQGQFVSSVHQYIRDNIQFADQKATFFFAGTTALLAVLYKLEVTSRWLKPVLAWNVLDLAAMLAVVGLGVGSMLALMVVIPRLPGSRRGMIFWEAIAQFQTARQYADDIAQLSNAALTQNLAEHCYDLALVCKKKYRLLRWSIIASAIGAAACVLLFAFTSPPANDKPAHNQPATNSTK